MKKNMAYLWTKYGPPRLIEIFDGREDLEKKPEIPESSKIVEKLKAAADKAHKRRGGILDKWRKNI